MPVKMDHMTAKMCKEGSRRLGYARVLVEIDASKAYVDKVKIDNSNMNVKRTKWVKVEYSCKPDRCNHYGVVGHSFNNCKSKPKSTVEVEKGINQHEKGRNNTEGFVEVRNRKNRMTNQGNHNHGHQGNNVPSKRDHVNKNVKYTYKPKNRGTKQNVNVEQDKTNLEISKGGTEAGKTKKISKENAKELKSSANKYAVLSDEENGSNIEDEFTGKRPIVDEFIKKKLQPTATETNDWNYDMLNYFKYQWAAMERKDGMDIDDSEEEDVYVNQNGAIHDITANEVLASHIRGMSNELKQKEVSKFISDEKVHVCAILETHLKTKNISKVCDKDVQGKVKMYVSFIYASNSITERRDLWNKLQLSKRIVNNNAWILMWGFNVTAKPDEKSTGGSNMTTEMGEFSDDILTLKIDDICSP
ncbi:hypothetical protein Tco_1078031, partial [Tanacetum coccineum]